MSSSARESWMIGDLDSLQMADGRLSGKARREAEVAEEKRKLAQESRQREFNHAGNQPAVERGPVVNVTDGGASWLHRALQRAKEQAERECRSLEEVAAERWGSLEKLQTMIAGTSKTPRVNPAPPNSKTGLDSRSSFPRNSDRRPSERERDRPESPDYRRRGWRKSDIRKVSPPVDSSQSKGSLDNDNKSRSDSRTFFDDRRMAGERSDHRDRTNDRERTARRDRTNYHERTDHHDRTNDREPTDPISSVNDRERDRTDHRYRTNDRERRVDTSISTDSSNGDFEENVSKRNDKISAIGNHSNLPAALEREQSRNSAVNRSDGSESPCLNKKYSNHVESDSESSSSDGGDSSVSRPESDKKTGAKLTHGKESFHRPTNPVSAREIIVAPKILPRQFVSKLKGWSGKEFMREASGVNDERTNDGQSGRMGWDQKSDNGVLGMEPSPPPSPETELGGEDLTEEPVPVVTISKDELNRLSAKLLKAELAGKKKLVEKLRSKLDAAKTGCISPAITGNSRKPTNSATKPKSGQTNSTDKARIGNDVDDDDSTEIDDPSSTVSVLMRTNQRTGLSVPYSERRRVERRDDDDGNATEDKTSKRKLREGDSLLARDQTLADMVKEEKMTSATDQHGMFASLALDRSTGLAKTSEDFVIDDAFMERKVRKMEKVAVLDRSRAIKEQRAMEAVLDNCAFCLGARAFKKHLVVAKGPSTYVIVPTGRSMVVNQCCIAPHGHFATSLHLEEDVVEEVRQWQSSLTAMFKTMGQDVIFLELAIRLHKSPHLRVHCFPVPMEVGEMAPAYFKKEMMDCEGEWLQNKRLVKFGGTGGGQAASPQKAIPKGFPYFAVWFGLDGYGFGHVIEREDSFPPRFGQEIIAGMLEIDFVGQERDKLGHEKDFAGQLKRVAELRTMLKPFDWTASK